MQTSPEFPVSYGPCTVLGHALPVLATHAAAMSENDLGKCEVVFYNETARKICVNSPIRLQFDELAAARGLCAMHIHAIPPGISLAVIYYENDADKEIAESTLCVGNRLSDLEMLRN